MCADMGFRTVKEMVGRADMLEVDPNVISANPKLADIDLSKILIPAASLRPEASQTCSKLQDHGLETGLDPQLIAACKPALPDDPDKGPEKVKLEFDIGNTNRAVGTTLSHEVTKRFGILGLPKDTIEINLKGHAGQSLAAWLCPGITLTLEGDSNDYVGKGLSGGIIAVYPPKESTFAPEENVIVGNVCLYGATSGEAYISGIAAERFCVRNSGACAVVEGIGDHGCEYMTGGVAVILGKTGKNFGAGMSGGLAFVYDPDNKLRPLCNVDVASDLESVSSKSDIDMLFDLLGKHVKYTGSPLAKRILDNWSGNIKNFVKVYPHEYKKAIEEAAKVQEIKEEEEKLLSQYDEGDAFDKLRHMAQRVVQSGPGLKPVPIRVWDHGENGNGDKTVSLYYEYYWSS